MTTPERIAAQQRQQGKLAAARRAAENQDLASLAVPRRQELSGKGLPAPLSAIPILQCADLQRSVEFYSRLGFEAQQMSGYAVFVAASGAELHVSRTVRAAPGGCLIHVDDVNAFREVLTDRGFGPLDPVEEQGEPGAGLRALTLIDPDGNHLRFVSPLR